MATERLATGHSAFPRVDARGQRPPDTIPRAVWLLIGSIAVAKLTTLAVIVWLSRSAETVAVIAVTLPPWLLAAAACLAGPVLFRLRLRRVRARRALLHRAEWMLPQDSRPSAGASRSPRPRPQGPPRPIHGNLSPPPNRGRPIFPR